MFLLTPHKDFITLVKGFIVFVCNHGPLGRPCQTYFLISISEVLMQCVLEFEQLVTFEWKESYDLDRL